MFERYTEKSRRVIFFARYEASQYGSPYIETEHLLLGLMRENKALMNRLLGSEIDRSIRKQVDENTTVREKTSTSVDLPLSPESKRVLTFGAEESERLGHKHIGVAHLLAGLLREEKSFAAKMLDERGLRLSAVREELSREPAESNPAAPITVTNSPQIFNLPAEMHAELFRRAQASGVEIQALLLRIVNQSLHAPQATAEAEVIDGALLETYRTCRRQIEAAGFPTLDAAQLDEELAGRKGLPR